MERRKQENQSFTHPCNKILQITPSSEVLNPRPRSIRIGATAGTIDVTNGDDTTQAAFPVAAYDTIAFEGKKITAASAGVTVYGYYDAEEA